MGKNNSQRREQKRQKNRKNVINSHKHNKSNLNIEPRISTLGISVIHGELGLRLATDTLFSVQNEPNSLVVVKTIPQALIDKLKAVSSQFTFGGNLNPDGQNAMFLQSWPQSRHFLSEIQWDELKTKKFVNVNRLMMDAIANLSFGVYIYTLTDVERFLDTLTEITWIDYAIRQQLRIYSERCENEKYATTDYSFEFNPHVASCWITLENCVIRISAMWDRLIEFLLPLYFFGKTYNELRNQIKNKKALADKISALSFLDSVQI